MKIQTPPGMRDFYPDEMRVQSWLFEEWRRVSRAFGFSEYDGPIFEFLELYTLKSGDEIVKQLFHVRHGQSEEARFAIRPEMTPTLARMVAARANSLPRPIKWFSIPRMCRAERHQRGRLREFFQWNADILGSEDPLADAEVIAVAVEFLRRVGLTPEEVAVRVSARPLAIALLKTLGLDAEQSIAAFQLIDRREKLSDAEFEKSWTETFGPAVASGAVDDLLRKSSLEACCDLARTSGLDGARAAEQFLAFWNAVDRLGIRPFCTFDLTIVRGLAYYTGTVFEVHPRQVPLSAIMGGGRYDNLTGLLDGPDVPGVGFGMGDVRLVELLTALGKLPELADAVDVFVIDADPGLFDRALEVVSALRRQELAVDFSYKRLNVGKQFKLASARQARFAAIVGAEFGERREVVIKNMATGAQTAVPVDRLMDGAAKTLAELG